MNVSEALTVIKDTKWTIVEGDDEQFLQALITIIDEACVTAEWIYVESTPFFDNVYKCSNCGKRLMGRSITNWCGDCGCKMKVRK